MHLDLPIEQLVRRKDTRFQYGFATEAKKRVPAGGAFLLSASNNGLHVLAKNEDDLATPVELLHDVYGAKLEVRLPRVRFIEGVHVQEPIMQVRISLLLGYAGVVRQALEARGATRTGEHSLSRYCVLRYEAPLADLLGLPAELARLTQGAARHWIVLSHYALVTRDPGGNAA
jgi:predicted membrane GTPase involved in stress response